MTSTADHPEEEHVLGGSNSMMMSSFPLLLSLIAGGSTSVGAAIVFCTSPKTIEQSLSFSLALAGSVMLTVSVISLGPEILQDTGNDGSVLLERAGSFGLGCFLYYLLSKFAFPEPQNILIEASSTPVTPRVDDSGRRDHSDTITTSSTTKNNSDSSPTNNIGVTRLRRVTTSSSLSSDGLETKKSKSSPLKDGDPFGIDADDDEEQQQSLLPSNNNSISTVDTTAIMEQKRSARVALLLFVSLLCHNFPEGLAVVASSVEDQDLGITVAIAILIHNIPEGIAIAVPCTSAHYSKWTAFGLASLSGLAEPCGAYLALWILGDGNDETSNNKFPFDMESVLAFTAGIMISVALLELYPEAIAHSIQYQQQSPTNHKGGTTKPHGFLKGLVLNGGTQSIWAGTIMGIVIMVTTEWIV